MSFISHVLALEEELENHLNHLMGLDDVAPEEPLFWSGL